MNYNIEKVGVTTKGMYGLYPTKLESDFIITSPSFNNDFLIEPTFPEKGEFIVSLNNETDTSVLLYHIQSLHRRYADVVLVDKDNPRLLDLKFLKEAGTIKKLGLKTPKSLNELRTFNEENGIDFITLSLHPLHFDLNIIRYCALEDIQIIGLCDKVSEDLPLSFNLSFHSRYCEYIVLGYTEDYKFQRNYIMNLIGKECPKEIEMTRSVEKEGTIKIGISLKVSDDIIIPCTENDVLINPEEIVFGFGRTEEKVPKILEPQEGGPELDPLENTAYLLFSHIADKDQLSREDITNLLRYRIANYIDYKYNIGRISNYAVIIIVRAKDIETEEPKKKKEVWSYLLFITEDKELYFRKLKNAAPEV